MAGRKDLSRLLQIDQSDIELLEVVGRGTFGTVYKASLSDNYVAVKIFEQESEFKAFSIEVRQLSRVDHPNIILLYGACTNGTSPCLVMEYAENGSLHKMLHGKHKPRYTASHGMSWARQCSEGVAYLHAMRPKPLIHRDLKPPNLLLVNKGTILKICDFGTVADKSTQMTNNKGSAAWMAPEVFEGSSYTEKCDVFSWSIILWEILARREPYKEFGIAYSVMWRVHKGDRPPLIKNCPKPIEKLMTSCWDRNPANRPSMDDVVIIMNTLCNFFPNADEPIDFNDLIEEEPTTSNNIENDQSPTFNSSIPSEFSSSQMNSISEALNPQYTNNSSEYYHSGNSTIQDGQEARWASPLDNERPRIIGKPLSHGLLNGVLKPNDVHMSPLTVEVDPNTWELNHDAYKREMQNYSKSQGKEILTVTESKSSVLPEERSGATSAAESTLDSDTMHLMLDPELQPETPDPNSRLSQEIFQEHKELAEEYLKIETEIAYVSRHKEELLAAMDPQERQRRLDFRKKLDEKESLLGLQTYLMECLETIKARQRDNPNTPGEQRPSNEQDNIVLPDGSDQNDDGWVYLPSNQS